ncbi:hypothetical protein QF049_001218 [Paenibacillus sp. W4I10]|nr:hypothetical protein [Paenibacillus sp. W4I10]
MTMNNLITWSGQPGSLVGLFVFFSCMGKESLC